MSRPIALLSDFGYDDAFVGVMKGVLLTRCPDARLIDVTHGVPAHDVRAGALLLAAAAPYLPSDTVFLAVVDPGVGGERRPLCARGGSQLFVGPDNGLLSLSVGQRGVPEWFHLDRPRYWLQEPGATFHGRDIFAPIAALLALGRAPEDFGSPVNDPARVELPAPVPTAAGVQGEVLLVDGFGNAVTNLRPADLDHPEPGSRRFRVEGSVIPGPVTHYGAVAPGEPLVVLGSMGFYEVALNGASAAAALGLRPGSPVLAGALL